MRAQRRRRRRFTGTTAAPLGTFAGPTLGCAAVMVGVNVDGKGEGATLLLRGWQRRRPSTIAVAVAAAIGHTIAFLILVAFPFAAAAAAAPFPPWFSIADVLFHRVQR